MSLDRSEGTAGVSWGEGPLALWRAGMQVIDVWQRVWLDNVSRAQGLFSIWPATSEKALAPWTDLAGRWKQRTGALAPAGTKAPAELRGLAVPVKKTIVAAPVAAVPVPAESSAERLAAEAAIAAKQGRLSPRLGCLEGVEVVGGPASVAPVVETKAEAAALEAPAAPAVPAALGAAADSVTSMLAMQAKSLARAVRSPRRQAAAKPAAKVAAKAEAKADVPAKAKADVPAKAKADVPAKAKADVPAKAKADAPAKAKAVPAVKVAKTPVPVLANAPAKKSAKPSTKARPGN